MTSRLDSRARPAVRLWLLLLCAAAVPTVPLPGHAQSRPGSAPTAASPAREARDGSHDFDFEIGTWKTRLRRLVRPLSGSAEWAEYEGTSVVSKVWDGRANLVELDAAGPAGRIQALSLRLYNPEARQWSLNFSSPRSGTLSPPAVGEFRGNRGEFYAQETFDGRAILMRFVITAVTPDSCTFEQAFSDDGGRTWEVNWIATDTRVKDSAPTP
jgi:hypothetical protein